MIILLALIGGTFFILGCSCFAALSRIATALEVAADAATDAKTATLAAVQEARQAIATMKQQRAASDAAVTASLKRMETVTQDLLRRVPAKKGFRTQ